MVAVNDIRWGRVLLGGLFIELSMLAIVLPLNSISRQAAYYLVPLLAFSTAVFFGYWAAKPLLGRFVLHGALVAVVASLIYVTLTTAAGAPVPLLFHLSHGVRLLGGMLGGRLAGRRGPAMSRAKICGWALAYASPGSDGRPTPRQPEAHARVRILPTIEACEEFSIILVMFDSPMNPPLSTTSPVSVLVVDDEPSIRDFLSRVLTGAGYCVGTATNGDEALAFTTPDVLLTDVVMPHMTGEELARRMRERDPNVRVLYLTGHSDGLFTAKGLWWEGEAFLDKPVTAAGVIQAIDLLLA